MDKPWFDAVTGRLLFDDYICEMPSFQKAMADEKVTGDELRSQVKRVEERMRALEQVLSPEQKSVATEALSELAVLNVMMGLHTGGK